MKTINLLEARKVKQQSDALSVSFSVIKQFFGVPEEGSVVELFKAYRDLFHDAVERSGGTDTRSARHRDTLDKLLNMEGEVTELEVTMLVLTIISIDIAAENKERNDRLRKLLTGFAAVTGKA